MQNISKQFKQEIRVRDQLFSKKLKTTFLRTDAAFSRNALVQDNSLFKITWVLRANKKAFLRLQVYIGYALLHTNNLVNQAVHSLSESKGRWYKTLLNSVFNSRHY